MNPKEFVTKLLPFARQTEEKTGIAAEAILTQAALESGWGKFAPGNMYFGVKDKDGQNGNEQLLRTTEYSRVSNLKFPIIHSVKPTIIRGQKYFKYVVSDYFRKYETPEECFTDHANFFIRNKRYATALRPENAKDPIKFLTAIHIAGYATDPQYVDKMRRILKTIKTNIPTNESTPIVNPVITT